MQEEKLQFLGGFLAPRGFRPSAPLLISESSALSCGCLPLLPGACGQPLPPEQPPFPCPDSVPCVPAQAEDPYYTENGSQGNTMLMSPSQEPAELQEKPNLPNLNGGTQENGTGQASSKNGHSARQHSPADTEM